MMRQESLTDLIQALVSNLIYATMQINMESKELILCHALFYTAINMGANDRRVNTIAKLTSISKKNPPLLRNVSLSFWKKTLI